MEYKPKKCSRAHSKDRVNFYKDLLHVCSQNSSTSRSDLFLHPYKIISRKPKKKDVSQTNSKRHNLTKIFEKKKLKDKSLSKKMKTPFDRKLNRTCWPIELGKVSRIKKKPEEKKRGKPTCKSLTRRKFSKPAFIYPRTKVRRKKSSSTCSSRSEFIDDDHHAFTVKHFLYEPVTPQMLLDVLLDPEHLKSGATINMVITKLRALKLDLNPSQELLKEEVSRKLGCAIKLGLVVENQGFYRIADEVRKNKLPRKKIKSIWEAWHRCFPPIKR